MERRKIVQSFRAALPRAGRAAGDSSRGKAGLCKGVVSAIGLLILRLPRPKLILRRGRPFKRPTFKIPGEAVGINPKAFARRACAGLDRQGRRRRGYA